MNTSSDHYAALGVARDADPEVISAAFRALAKKYHPDTSATKSSAQLARFQRINEAYSVLSNVKSRAEYDELTSRPRPTETASKPAQRAESPKASTPVTSLKKANLLDRFVAYGEERGKELPAKLVIVGVTIAAILIWQAIQKGAF